MHSDIAIRASAKTNTPGATDQSTMGNSKYGRRNLCLGILVVGQILCLAQANGGNKPNGWDSVLEPDLNSNGGGAKETSSGLRGTGRELKHSVSGVSDRVHVCIIRTRLFLDIFVSRICTDPASHIFYIQRAGFELVGQ